jgi:hypothetical protein
MSIWKRGIQIKENIDTMRRCLLSKSRYEIWKWKKKLWLSNDACFLTLMYSSVDHKSLSLNANVLYMQYFSALFIIHISAHWLSCRINLECCTNLFQLLPDWEGYISFLSTKKRWNSEQKRESKRKKIFFYYYKTMFLLKQKQHNRWPTDVS